MTFNSTRDASNFRNASELDLEQDAEMNKKRTLDAFFQPASKKPRQGDTAEKFTDNAPEDIGPPSNHPTYPFTVPRLPAKLATSLSQCPKAKGQLINDQPDLDLLYFKPYIARTIERDLFEFLRRELFFYRVDYKIKRGGIETQIHTPRYFEFVLKSTTVFGVDETSKFAPTGELLDATSSKPVPKDRYKTCTPRPIPHCLDELRKNVETQTLQTFNFCLVNYYATGADSISYHSDDERFLGPDPAIASFSLGAPRDFLMKHKPPPPTPQSQTSPLPSEAAKPLKLSLASGDMVLMRGPTQGNWLHSIPKRKDGGGGRINITFRKAMVKGGTENYYCYNVGSGGIFRWDDVGREMKPYSTEKGRHELG
ncbi:MAG: hypothetical protein M4579_002550 [Chaenotheca gracillima]|nr:MAG: hypothetical protein M4579_002550 [Chaenotheca gracillima]